MASLEFPRCSPNEEYYVGQILSLHIRDDEVPPSVMRVRIRKIHTRTLSCTMVVDILDQQHTPAHGPKAFLKLFDRRFADSLREQNGIEPWTRAMERSYVQFVEGGEVDEFLNYLNTVENFQADTEADWDDAQNEAFLANELLRFYETEVMMYEELREHQGRDIPELLAAFELNITPPNTTAGGSEHFKVKGILLQFIDGCDLWEMPDHCPQTRWQNIVDEAVSLIRLLHDHELLNRDVRPENFMVTTDIAARPKVFMIDFALVRYRRNDESDDGWGRIKNVVDEEGAIGLVMKRRLLVDYGFRLRYEDSGRFAQWAQRQGNFSHRAVGRELRDGAWLHCLWEQRR